MSLARYSLLVVSLASFSLGALWPLLETETRRAAVAGVALAMANTLIAYSLVLWSQGRSTRAFLGAVLGGMVGRMAVMLAAVAAAILALGLPRLPLVTSLLAYFVLFLGLELAVLQKSTPATAGRR